MGVGYRTGVTVYLGMTCVECGNSLCASGGNFSTVFKFAKIVWISLIANNFELHMPVGTSLSSVDHKFMAWVVLSSSVKWGCVIYLCKYSDVSVIIKDLVLLSIAWMQR